MKSVLSKQLHTKSIYFFYPITLEAKNKINKKVLKHSQVYLLSSIRKSKKDYIQQAGKDSLRWHEKQYKL